MKSIADTIKAVIPQPTKKEKPKKGKTEQEPAQSPAVPRKPPEDIEAYYESNRSCFWSINGHKQWQKFTTDEMVCMLKNRGYSSKSFMEGAATEIDSFLHRMRFWCAVDWAGELAGWETGKREIAGMNVLIIRGRKPIEPQRGSFPLIKSFLKSLLGPVQLPYFLGWLKGSLQALDEPYPFRPGQLVAFCGSVNCGKSFLQLLTTQILGGRQGDPTEFLLGNTTFTADFFKAEHLLIEDKALKDFSHSKRRAFAANLKGLIVNQDQRIHPKGKEATLLPVNTRITLSCNDAPEALAILPALDGDVAEKVIYFLCSNGKLPMKSDRNVQRHHQWSMFLAELPAFVYYLMQYEIPAGILDPNNRFTVKEFHHEEIVHRLSDLTPEQRLLQLIETLDVPWGDNGQKTGTAAEIEGWMRKVDNAHQLDRILSYANSMGTLLSKIAKEGDERVKLAGSARRKQIYRIFRDEL